MLAIAANTRIFFFQTPIDMRKGLEALSILVAENCDDSLTSGTLFVFINRLKDRIKVFYWDHDGFAIWWKRLEKGTFRLLGIHKSFINRKEFFMLLEGITPKKIQKRFAL